MTETEPTWITLDDALTFHESMIALYRGEPGVRDSRLIESALARARNVYAYESQDLAEEALRLTDGKGPDLVVESVGGDVLLKSIDAVAFNGTVVTCGAHAGEIVKLNVIELFRKHVRFQGSHYASKHEVAHVLSLVATGSLKPVIHKVAALADIQDMARLTANRSFFGKMVLLP